MKIAVPTKENNHIDDHFGHCEFYTIYTISDQNVILTKERLESPQGCGCKSNIAYDLAEMGVSIMLAGGIGEGAINKLASQNIEVIRNCKGNDDEIVSEYLAGNINDGGSSCAAHASHDGDEGHVCNH
ncbi:MAG: dinitrogenase iron-molybdenum cofactor biosynthesis protein [Paludibacter sp.]|nr:dinitrogenase iron-molybdenum cofactor biosynthesis protein [Paludibacter sp.]